MEKTYKDRQRENKDPLQFAIYKGARGKHGALRLSLKKAYADSRRGKSNGCVFLDAAPTSGPDNYDWENNKIIMSLSVTDISKIILFLRNPKSASFIDRDKQYNFKRDSNGNFIYKPLNIFHDRNAGTANRGKSYTSVTISKPDDKINFFFNVKQVLSDDNVKSATIPVSPDECVAIIILLQSSIKHILAWDSSSGTTQLEERITSLENRFIDVIAALRK